MKKRIENSSFRRVKRRKQEKKEIEELKKKEAIKAEADFEKRTLLIDKLKSIRKKKDYYQIKSDRQQVVRDLKDCLDYPNFRKINLKTFFSIKELGTIDRRKT